MKTMWSFLNTSDAQETHKLPVLFSVLRNSWTRVCMLRCVSLFVTPWTVACQAPLSKGFPRQEYWGGLPFPNSEDLPDSEIEPTSLLSPALAGRFFTTSSTSIIWEAKHYKLYKIQNSISKRHPTYLAYVKNSYNSATKTIQFLKMGKRWYFLGDSVAKDSVLPIQGPWQWFWSLIWELDPTCRN